MALDDQAPQLGKMLGCEAGGPLKKRLGAGFGVVAVGFVPPVGYEAAPIVAA